MYEIDFGEIENILVGSSQDKEAGTGCTVVLTKAGGVCGVDVRGGSPGTRETDLLASENMIDRVHGILLAGGSAFGLDGATGVMDYLEEEGIGFDVSVAKVPIVPGAVLFDLNFGDPRVRPNRDMAYEACKNANKGPVLNGNYGAGTGATIGKFLGPERSMKGGLGSYAIRVGDLEVGAIVAVNALGDIYDEEEGRLIAGLLNESRDGLSSTEDELVKTYESNKNVFNGNTTIGILVTNASFTKPEMNKLASMAHNGYGRSIRPAHTIYDGDTIFALSTSDLKADINVVGFLGARVMAKAVVNGVKAAQSSKGIKSYQELVNKSK